MNYPLIVMTGLLTDVEKMLGKFESGVYIFFKFISPSLKIILSENR